MLPTCSIFTTGRTLMSSLRNYNARIFMVQRQNMAKLKTGIAFHKVMHVMRLHFVIVFTVM